MERIYTCRLTKENIQNIFSSNYKFSNLLCDIHPDWLLKNIDNWNTTLFVKDVWSILERNGYTYTFLRCSNNPENITLYDAVQFIDLEYNGTFVCSVSNVRYESMLEQLIIKAITNHLINIDYE